MSGDWREWAICSTHPTPDMWTEPWGEAAALAICQHCPVQRPCLKEALDGHRVVGVWGGTTTDERTNILRRRRHAPLDWTTVADLADAGATTQGAADALGVHRMTLIRHMRSEHRHDLIEAFDSNATSARLRTLHAAAAAQGASAARPRHQRRKAGKGAP